MVSEIIKSLNGDNNEHIKLLQTESLCPILVDKGNNGIIIIQDEKVKYVNTKSLETSGFSKEELIGQSIQKLVHPEYKDLVIERYEKRLKNEKVPERYEIAFISKTGRTVPIEISGNLIEYENRPAVLVIVNDITERKKLENKQKQSEADYEQVVSSIDAIVWKADVADDGNFINTYISPVAEKVLGMEQENIDLDWDDFFNYIHPDDAPNVIRNLKMMAESQISAIDYEYRIIRPDGTQLWLYEKGTARVNSKGILQIFGSTMDVTGKKKTRAMLKSKRNRAQRYFNVAKVIMMVLNTELKVVQINKRGCEIIGYPEENIVGKNWCESFVPYNRKKDSQRLLSSLLNKDELSFEYYENIILTNTGEEKTIAWHISILKDENGDIEGILCSGEDITVRKEAEYNLINAKLEAEASNRTKSEFMANVSHELRTPLNSVIGFADVLQNESFGPLNEKQKKYIGNVLKNGQNLLRIINKILSLSAIEAKSTQLRVESLRFSEIFKKTEQELLSLAKKKDITIKNNVDTTLQIDADKEKLGQILLDLIDNSIKFTDVGGSITIDAKNESDAVHITVTDTGIGISETELDKMFNEFYQIDGSSTRRYGGNGIGLPLVKYYVEMHGGKIWVDSKEGVGTSVHLLLPLKQK